MELVFHAEAAAFRQRADALLSRRETENQLLLGILHAARSSDGTRLCTVEAAGRVLAAAVQVPQRPLVLARAEVAALQLLAREWHRQGLPLTILTGPAEATATFADAWPGERLAMARSMRGYELTRVVPPRPVGGGLRVASIADVALLTAWLTAFTDESGGHSGDPAQLVADGLREQRLFLWEAGQVPLAMTAWTGRTPTSARVSHVYTPPELRGRGYASACVAAVSQRLLDEGLERCFLFADLANPTSNGLYQRLGYRAVADYGEYRVASLM